MTDLPIDVQRVDEVASELRDDAGVRGRIIDRLADIMLAAEEVRELAEIARIDEPDFATVDRLMQHVYDEMNQRPSQVGGCREPCPRTVDAARDRSNT
jgi:hypothetical protein